MPQYEAGTYNCRIVGQKLSKNERTSNYQVVITVMPLEQQDPAGEWHIVDGEERSMYFAVTEKAAQWTVDRLATLGLFFDDWAQVDENNPNCCSIVGCTAVVNCKLETYDGRLRERWDVATASAAPQSVDDSQAAEVQALFGHLLKPVAKPKAQSSAKRAGDDVETEPTADEMPF